MNGLAERHAVRPGESTPGGSELPAPRGEPADSLTGEPARHPDPDGLAAASRVVYRIRQRFRYTYDGPAADLVHRLVAVPPRRHGDQTCRRAHVAVSAPDARLTWQRGPDGLRVATVRIPVVPPVLDFDITVEVERVTAAGPPALPASALSSRRLLAPTRLTEPSPELVAAARSLACEDPVLTARRICSWVHQRIAYAAGSTDVTTTAAQALAGGRGVCQDQAHVMIAMCRAVGIPARYVLGHMLGEGASHAWVEVIVPPGRAEAAGTGAGAAGAAAAPGRAAAVDPWAGGGHAGGTGAVALPFDPCHDRMADLRYVTVAVGRDYQDVAPTSGTYVGRGRGTLVATQRVDVLETHLPPAPAA